MAAIDDLIAQIEDKTLRERLQTEINQIAKGKKFGLVFENHLPELTLIYAAQVRKHSKVALRAGPLTDLWRVLSIQNGAAHCWNLKSGEARRILVADLVVVRQFGEPIFPALIPVDKVQSGPDDAPWHTLIEADNYHALQLLEYLYAGQVDCIYIDPPYNTGARDWKYNNDYVDGNDGWRHSKWLAFMLRRLELAKHLLNPDDSVLIVTIDENEVFHLGVLLNQIFPKCKIQMTTIVINPKGTARYNEFSRVEEYAFFVFLGSIRIQSIGSDMLTTRDYSSETHVRWRGLARTGRKGLRSNNPGSWYPIFLKKIDHSIHSIGDAIGIEESESEIDVPVGTIAVWPPSKGNSQYSWGTIPKTLRLIHAKGGLKTGRINLENSSFPFYYLSAGLFEKIDKGQIMVTGRSQHDELIVEYVQGLKSATPRSVWNRVYHDAGSHGTSLLQKIVPTTAFPFPKSLYAVRDSLRLFTAHKPNALVLDFFAGSGTTLNAVNLLNATDGGQRRCILVTNNEVSAEEAENLRHRGLQPGHADWEAQGICRSVAWLRSKFTIQGYRPHPNPLPLGEGEEKVWLPGDYLTGKTVEKEKPRNFKPISFIDPATLDTPAKKKQLVALIDGIPQSEVQKDSAFVVSEKHPASILFDESQADAWLEALEEQDHIIDFYIVTASKPVFDNLKARIQELLGPVVTTEEEKRPLRDGFP
ncbi:MAG: hypothetical protein QG599_980, partial [Pseudomonadota bacterium]|nr:hypothetical protein [Pseudomonadota bacterium]